MKLRVNRCQLMFPSRCQTSGNLQREEALRGWKESGGAQDAVPKSTLDLMVECQGVVSMATRVQVHVSVVDAYKVRQHCGTQTVTGSKRGEFLTSVSFCVDYNLHRHSRMEVRLYSADGPAKYTKRSCLGFTSFSIRDLLRSKEPHTSLSLRTMDGGNEVGEVKVSRLQVEEEDETPPEHRGSALCDALHFSVHDKENSPMMRAVLCSQVCKVYRFETEDQRRLLVREQMSETPLSFSLPKQLLSALIQEHASRVQQVKELSDLSPHWDSLRHDVISYCNHLIGCYQETLTELENLSTSPCFKSSGRKSDRHLQFVPTNLHSQRMEVTAPGSSGVWYQVITFGAPADHHQAFKHGGLKRLLSKHQRKSSVSYSLEESCRARELLVSVAQLPPLIFGQAEELLSVSAERNPARLQEVLDGLMQETKLFIHALNDELVRSALTAFHSQCTSVNGRHGNGLLCEDASANQEEAREYDEEEWDRTAGFVVEVPLPSETFASLPQELKDGSLIRVESVLFNIGINQHQSLAERFGDSSLQERVNQQSGERLRAYCHSLRDKLPHTAGVQSLPDLLSALDRSLEVKKRKNVEVLWIAGTMCHKVNGIRLTSCKSAKDRTAMSVTLEQCLILREQHTLSQKHFSMALDCMRRDGCRMENVQKNIGSRKFAFSSVQLLTFPKLYRPPDGTYG
uniref:Inositol polyphosphate-4-phosphatase, type II n=1 Tax=Nothobranchius korthausae TaxID=1143690 RepID=A0A1A8GX94_9TELE